MVRSMAQSVTGVLVVIVAVRRQLYRMANSPNNEPKMTGKFSVSLPEVKRNYDKLPSPRSQTNSFSTP